MAHNRSYKPEDILFPNQHILEERGIIGPVNGSKPREVLIKLENSDNQE